MEVTKSPFGQALNWALEEHHLLSLRTFQGVLQDPISWAMSELKYCPLQFHEFKSVDHLKGCPSTGQC